MVIAAGAVGVLQEFARCGPVIAVFSFVLVGAVRELARCGFGIAVLLFVWIGASQEYLRGLYSISLPPRSFDSERCGSLQWWESISLILRSFGPKLCGRSRGVGLIPLSFVRVDRRDRVCTRSLRYRGLFVRSDWSGRGDGEVELRNRYLLVRLDRSGEDICEAGLRHCCLFDRLERSCAGGCEVWLRYRCLVVRLDWTCAGGCVAWFRYRWFSFGWVGATFHPTVAFLLSTVSAKMTSRFRSCVAILPVDVVSVWGDMATWLTFSLRLRTLGFGISSVWRRGIGVDIDSFRARGRTCQTAVFYLCFVLCVERGLRVMRSLRSAGGTDRRRRPDRISF